MKTCYYAGTDRFRWSKKNNVGGGDSLNTNSCLTAVHAGTPVGNPYQYLKNLGIFGEKYGMAISQMDLGIADSETISCLIELGKLLGIEVKHEDVLV